MHDDSAAAHPHDSTSAEWVLRISCPDKPGIVHQVTGALMDLNANITESQQFGNPESNVFFLRLQFTTTAMRSEIAAVLEPVQDRLELEVRS